MYDPQFTRTPCDVADFWRMVEHNLEDARHVLFDFPVESREEALRGDYRVGKATHTKPVPMRALTYREIDAAYDQTDYCLRLGRDVYSIVLSHCLARNYTPAFAQAWGALQFCHGYLASHLLDTTDTLGSARGGSKSGQARAHIPQKVWFARMALMGRVKGLKRSQIERILLTYINEERNSGRISPTWTRVIVDEHQFKDAFQEKRLSFVAMAQLVQLYGDVRIPETPDIFPDVPVRRDGSRPG